MAVTTSTQPILSETDHEVKRDRDIQPPSLLRLEGGLGAFMKAHSCLIHTLVVIRHGASRRVL